MSSVEMEKAITKLPTDIQEQIYAEVERLVQLDETKSIRKEDLLNESITQVIKNLSEPKDARSMTDISEKQAILLSLMLNAGRSAGYNPYIAMCWDIVYFLMAKNRSGRTEQKDIAIARLGQKREEEVSSLRNEIMKELR